MISTHYCYRQEDVKDSDSVVLGDHMDAEASRQPDIPYSPEPVTTHPIEEEEDPAAQEKSSEDSVNRVKQNAEIDRQAPSGSISGTSMPLGSLGLATSHADEEEDSPAEQEKNSDQGANRVKQDARRDSRAQLGLISSASTPWGSRDRPAHSSMEFPSTHQRRDSSNHTSRSVRGDYGYLADQTTMSNLNPFQHPHATSQPTYGTMATPTTYRARADTRLQHHHKRLGDTALARPPVSR